MSECFAEIAILEELNTLPANMQKIYMQLVSAIDKSLQRLKSAGATPGQLSEDFIESVVDQLVEKSISQDDLENMVDEEFMRRILEGAELSTVS